MIADSGTLLNSVWQPESWSDVGDCFHSGSVDGPLQGMDLDITAMESEIECVGQYYQEFSAPHLGLDSQGTSVASSVCSDELSFDIEANLEEMLFGSTTSFNSLLDLPDFTSSLEWSDSESGICDNITSSPSDRVLTSARHDRPSRQWNQRTTEEQIEVVEELSRVISNELGLREQLEVIRLINPSADVSPTDKEFVIDLESITDDKLEKIEQFIKTQSEDTSSSEDPHSHSPQKKVHKRTVKDRKGPQKVPRQRQRKEYRQMMKEKRSGLFVKEEVFALSVCDSIEEVDILA